MFKKTTILRTAYLTLIAFLISLSSCNKEVNNETKLIADTTTKYLLDDSQISKVEFESLRENDDIITHSHYADNTNGESYLQERAYTSSDLYYSWGDQLDLKLREADAYAKEMADFAETSGAIKAYEETGEVPVSFTSFSDKKYLSYFGEESNEAKRGSSAKLYRNEYAFRVMIKTLPFFSRRYRKKVKYVEHVGYNGLVDIFRKSFDRRRIARVTGRPQDGKIYLYGAANRNKSAFKVY